MDERRIEELLRESLAPSDETQERVLRRARQELHARRRAPWFLQLKPALAAVALVTVLICNVSDHARGQRMAALTDGASHGMSAPFFAGGFLRQRRHEIESLLAQAPFDQLPFNGSKGDASL